MSTIAKSDDPGPDEVARRLRFAMEVLNRHESTTGDGPVCKTKDCAEAVAELMRLAEYAADYLDPPPTDATRRPEPT
jgi:hypothetical protein